MLSKTRKAFSGHQVLQCVYTYMYVDMHLLLYKTIARLPVTIDTIKFFLLIIVL